MPDYAPHQATKAVSDSNEKRFPWKPGQLATGKRFIPNLPVVTHDGQSRMFYDDLIKGRTVILQFMSIAHAATYPAVSNMTNVQRLLGSKLGRDVCIYSLTTDPLQDTTDRLMRLARKLGVRPGWSFLTGDALMLSAIQTACFFHGSCMRVTPNHHHAHASQMTHRSSDADDPMAPAAVPDCSKGLLRYGNDLSGLWGSVPAKTDAEMIVERLSWITPRDAPRNPSQLKRKGPLPSEVKHYQ